MGHLDWFAFAQGNFGFMQFGEDLFDGVTKTWHAALLSARPQHKDLDSFEGARSTCPRTPKLGYTERQERTRISRGGWCTLQL